MTEEENQKATKDANAVKDAVGGWYLYYEQDAKDIEGSELIKEVSNLHDAWQKVEHDFDANTMYGDDDEIVKWKDLPCAKVTMGRRTRKTPRDCKFECPKDANILPHRFPMWICVYGEDTWFVSNKKL